MRMARARRALAQAVRSQAAAVLLELIYSVSRLFWLVMLCRGRRAELGETGNKYEPIRVCLVTFAILHASIQQQFLYRPSRDRSTLQHCTINFGFSRVDEPKLDNSSGLMKPDLLSKASFLGPSRRCSREPVARIAANSSRYACTWLV